MICLFLRMYDHGLRTEGSESNLGSSFDRLSGRSDRDRRIFRIRKKPARICDTWNFTGNAKVQGHLHYKGQELTPERQRQLRGKEIALVPQSVSFLDPLMKVGCAGRGTKNTGIGEKTKAIVEEAGTPGKNETALSVSAFGGMARRVLVSTALITDAELIVADEPTPGMSLDQALEALKMFREMADEGKAVILITHDIDLAVEFADRVAVFYAGTTVETAWASDFKQGADRLRHPYSKALWNALPQNGFQPIEGFQPYAGNLPQDVCLLRAVRIKQKSVRRKFRRSENAAAVK